MIHALKTCLILALVTLVSACDPTSDLAEPTKELGDYRLGFTAVVMPEPTVVPGSRSASLDEWKTALSGAVEDRFGRYTGEKLYHFGISVEVYNLAAIDIPGVPTPKSALGVSVTLWDDAKGAKVNAKPKTITVLGILSGAGIQPTKDVQLANLSALAVKSIENWLLENPEWFGLPPASE